MECNHINLIYFSATYTTRKILYNIVEGIAIENTNEYDITKGQKNSIICKEEELTIFGVPVYSGRVPSNIVESLQCFKGDSTPAIIICAYGNREFDDTLIELHDIVKENGFKVIAAGAFIAQHSIFPQTGHARPDIEDKAIIKKFGQDVFQKLQHTETIKALPELNIKGNHPYRKTSNIPLAPRVNRHCNACGKCILLCPVAAINEDNPRKTDKRRCITCARCIYICPKHARYFGGLLYLLASKKFNKKYAERKEPYMVY